MALLDGGALVERARKVRLVVVDVDGVLSPPTLTFSEDGETLKPFDVRDGLGIRLLMDSGIEVAVITARSSAPLKRRMRDLKISHFYANRGNKRRTLDELAQTLGLQLSEICFVGDDLFDVPCLKVVGLPVCVSDARDCALEHACYITKHPGGKGGVRDIADIILDAQFGLARVHAQFLEAEAKRADDRHAAATPAEVSTPTQPEFMVVIPSRYASTRLPGKPLIKLAGKAMILRVCENAERSSASKLCVATDDERIATVVANSGFTAVMTSKDHASGTDRLAEVIEKLALPDDYIIVNVQGDEPLLDPELIDRMAQSLFDNPTAGIATLATPIHDAAALFDANVVKVVLAQNGMALYFSRAPIPWVRGIFKPLEACDPLPRGVPFLRHVGLYAYRAGTIRRISKTPPPAFEQAESLEQLRAQWLGIGIHVTIVNEPPGHGVDTEADVARVEALLNERSTIPAAQLSEPPTPKAPSAK